jgi:circadian clock protein KaiC
MTESMKTGIAGLDNVLGSGFPRNRLYLVQGDPGVGKTTVALQFLMEGVKQGERVLYVTLSESDAELRAVGRSHGWTLEGIDVYEMSVGSAHDVQDDENTLYTPAEVELGERMEALIAQVDRVKPQRIVLDSCSELRLLAQTPLRFRRQVLALKQDLVARDCTILLLDNPADPEGDLLLQSLVHGVIRLEHLSPEYGAARRRLRVTKLREVAFRGGYHDMAIRHDGVVVFPRLIAAEHGERFERGSVSSGLPEIDKLLGGGLDRGTSTLVMGPAGTAKSALASQYATAAAARGERVAMFTFDEGTATLFARATALGMPLQRHVEAGHVTVQQIDPAELSPGEFVHTVRDAVERAHARMVILDSLNGYLQAMPEEQFLVVQLHELLSYLRQHGVVTIMVVAQHGFVGRIVTPVDVSYLADTVILMRYFETAGRVRKAMSVVKKRAGAHEDTIRTFHLSADGFRVGSPVTDVRGVLSGIVEHVT